MAFIKLFPPGEYSSLAVADVLRCLADEFAYVHADEEEGRDHVGGMIAAVLRLSDDLPFKQPELERLTRIQDQAVYVVFGDDPDVSASCCLVPGEPLFFGSTHEVAGAAKPLVERAATVLGYELHEG